MRRALPALLLAVLLALAGLGQALPADHHVELEADDGDGCLDATKTDCFRVVNDTTLDGIAQGDVVHVVLENVGGSPHNVHATEASNADENHADTSAEDAINASETIDPGETTDMLFQVPWEAEGLYLWCDVGTHEAGGMWLETEVATAVNATDGENTTNETQANGTEDEGDDVGRFLPAPGALAVLTGAGAALVLRRR